jgi:large subunit ribosomal protein L10
MPVQEMMGHVADEPDHPEQAKGGAMENPRPEKVAVVAEVRERLSSSQAALLTEYRGINVTEMSKLRRSLHQAGGEYKVYKNTLVRFAAQELGLEIDEWLTGPTAIAFVPSDSGGDPVTVAKALRDFAKVNGNLVVKGGVLGDRLLSADDAKALADLAPREVLLSQFASALQAPMRQFASLLQALPRNFAYGLKALIEDRGGLQETPALAVEPELAEPAEATADAGADDATATDEPVAAAGTDAAAEAEPAPVAAGETPVDTPDDTAAPAAETSTGEN